MLSLWWANFPWYEGYGPDGKPLLKEVMGAPPHAEEVIMQERLDNLGVRGTAGSGSGSVHASGNADAPTALTASTDTSSADASLGAGNWAATGGVNPKFKEKIREEVIAVSKNVLSVKWR
jgi:hypothetical protein